MPAATANSAANCCLSPLSQASSIPAAQRATGETVSASGDRAREGIRKATFLLAVRIGPSAAFLQSQVSAQILTWYGLLPAGGQRLGIPWKQGCLESIAL